MMRSILKHKVIQWVQNFCELLTMKVWLGLILSILLLISSNELHSKTTLLLQSGYLRWVVSQVQEQTHILHRTVLFKVLFEESSCLHVHLKYTVYPHVAIIFPDFIWPYFDLSNWGKSLSLPSIFNHQQTFMHMNLQSSSSSLQAFFFITCVAKNLHPWQQTQWRSYLHGRPAHSSLEVWPDLPVYKSGRQSEGRVHIKRSVISKIKWHSKVVILWKVQC